MIDLSIPLSVRDHLHALSNERLCSISCDSLDQKRYTYGRIDVETENHLIVVTNYEEDTPYFDEIEQIPRLQVSVFRREEKVPIQGAQPLNKYALYGAIKGVEIVDDDISFSSTPFRIKQSHGLIFSTEKENLYISTTGIFSEMLIPKISSIPLDSIITVAQVEEDWSDETPAAVKRKIESV